MIFSSSKVRLRIVCVAAVATLLVGFRSARMVVPSALTEAAETLEVWGANPRRWSKPLGFGAYRTLEVRDGTEFSWSVELFGIRGGRATRKYRLALEDPTAGVVWQVECRTRSIEAWRGGWNVELTDAFEPRLACGIGREGEAPPARLVLASDGVRLRGAVEDGAGGLAFELESVHQLEGTRLTVPGPAGYLARRAGEVVAAVETLNHGRVWLAPSLTPEETGALAAATAALLLYDPELTPDV